MSAVENKLQPCKEFIHTGVNLNFSFPAITDKCSMFEETGDIVQTDRRCYVVFWDSWLQGGSLLPCCFTRR